MSDDTKSVINTIKIWVAPSLLTFVGFLIWRDISDMRGDIKSLLQQQSANQARIEILEKEVLALQARLYSLNESNKDKNQTLSTLPIYAIKSDPIGDIKTEKKL